MSERAVYDIAREPLILLPSDEYVLPSGDRDAWSEIPRVGRVHEEFVEPASPIHKRPAVRIDFDDRPSLGNHLVDLGARISEFLSDAFDAIGGDEDGDWLAQAWHWLTHTYAGLLILMSVAVLDMFTLIMLFWAPHHHGG